MTHAESLTGVVPRGILTAGRFAFFAKALLATLAAFLGAPARLGAAPLPPMNICTSSGRAAGATAHIGVTTSASVAASIAATTRSRRIMYYEGRGQRRMLLCGRDVLEEAQENFPILRIKLTWFRSAVVCRPPPSQFGLQKRAVLLWCHR